MVPHGEHINKEHWDTQGEGKKGEKRRWFKRG